MSAATSRISTVCADQPAIGLQGTRMSFPLATARLVLRPFTRDDLASFTAYRNHPEVARYQGWSSYSFDDALAFFAEQEPLAFDTDETWFQIAAERRTDGQLVGDVAVHFLDEGRQAELGVTFDVQAQRQGYAREAVASVVELLFEQHGKHRLVATVDALNARAAAAGAPGLPPRGHVSPERVLQGRLGRRIRLCAAGQRMARTTRAGRGGRGG